MDISKELIQACSDGKRKAQNELYKLCFAPLLAICFRYTNNKDDAAALLNEAFLKILDNLDKLKGDTPFIAWARRITINHCIDSYKKDVTRKKYVNAVEDPMDLEREPDLTGQSDENKKYTPEMLEYVREEVRHLSPTTQEVFQLFIYEGYSHAEIAEITGMKEGTSKWHVNHARSLLKKALKKTYNLLSTVVL